MRTLKEISNEDLALYRKETGQWVVVEGYGQHSETREDLIIYQVIGTNNGESIIEPSIKFLEIANKDNPMKQEFKFMHYLDLNITLDDAINECSQQMEK